MSGGGQMPMVEKCLLFHFRGGEMSEIHFTARLIVVILANFMPRYQPLHLINNNELGKGDFGFLSHPSFRSITECIKCPFQLVKAINMN